MRIGLFGGSFNPIHQGHLGIAERALVDWALARVLFIPAKVNPFKVGASGTDVPGGLPDDLRWELVAGVCAANPRFEPWDVELRRADGPSYAIDTVRAAKARFPGAELVYIIGEDNVAGLPRWRDWETLRTLCRFVPYPRTRESSTEIRRRLVSGEPFGDLVPPGVAACLGTWWERNKTP